MLGSSVAVICRRGCGNGAVRAAIAVTASLEGRFAAVAISSVGDLRMGKGALAVVVNSAASSGVLPAVAKGRAGGAAGATAAPKLAEDRKSTRLNSSHVRISY